MPYYYSKDPKRDPILENYPDVGLELVVLLHGSVSTGAPSKGVDGSYGAWAERVLVSGIPQHEDSFV